MNLKENGEIHGRLWGKERKLNCIVTLLKIKEVKIKL